MTFLQRITDRQAIIAARLSYDQIKGWRKDFDKLVTVMMSVDFKTVADALKGYKEIGVLWKQYLKNLKEHLSRDYYAVVDYYKDNKDASDIKDRRATLGRRISGSSVDE